MKYIIYCLLPLCMMSCNSTERNAQQLLQQANEAFQMDSFNTAKQLIDSIKVLYPKAFETRRNGIKLMQQVELEEQQRNLVYLDSLLQVKYAQLDSIRSQYVLEKDTAYQEIGNYLWPTQTIERNLGRSFLRAQVDETGVMSLTSIYCGPRNIHHTAVRVSFDEVFAETPPSTDSYETTDIKGKIEKADFKRGNDGGVIDFVVANSDKKLKLKYLGETTFATNLTPTDIKAIVKIDELSHILSVITKAKDEQKEANLKIAFIQKKMSSTSQKADENNE
ncbi:MAG: hypothetical protein Q4E55_00555 [Bacteroidales bacterium]|nr:hypothetical protein [Bacteroidales bacterium]